MDSYLVCDYCSKKFKTKATIKRHMFRAHHPDGIPETFECEYCLKKFQTKYSMKRHIMQIHHSDGIRQALECAICYKTYRRNDLLQRHIHWSHGSNQISKPSSLECAHCKLKFTKSRLRIEHINRCHPNSIKRPVSKFTRLKCLLCSDLFLKQKELNAHYTLQHNIRLIFDKLQFPSFQNFEEWLENMKRDTFTHFVIYHRYKTLTKSNLQLICHRSRGYSDMPKENERRRSLKVNGYKGLDGYCPSEIRVTQFDNGTCDVVYQKTHVGHAVGDKVELKHIYLSESQKQKIATKIQSGIPLNQIRKKELLSEARSESIDRLGLLNNNDLHNIATKYKINIENSQRTQLSADSMDTEIFIEKNRNKILFYKYQGEDDCTYKKLEKSDFALVIMDSTYTNYLRLYGDKIIAMGCTRIPYLQDCILHTLLVLDSEEEGLPVAFLISNRNDQPVVDIFISCIRDQIGIIETQTLITGTQLTYRNSWSTIMAPPRTFLFCSWQVRETWRQNYWKISSREKRALLIVKLIDLAEEPNILVFEEKLASFLRMEDADTKSFIEYFKEFFLNNTNCWAYCFRQAAGINTNICVEMFHRIFKKSLAQSGKTGTIQQCLAYILECLILKQAEILQKEIKGKITSKLCILRKRHRTAFLYYNSGDQIAVTPIDDSTFLVTSFQNNESENYHVRKNVRKICCSNNTNRVCNLFCTSCNICYHEFCCSCQDYNIKNNMCEHIHGLGLWLQNNRVTSEEEEIESIVADDTSTNLVAENEINITETEAENSSSYWKEKVTGRLRQLATDVSTMSTEQLEVIYTKFSVNILADVTGENED